MNDDIGDEFARWWWPGQWLHIVYGVWIDQLWYWQNVRPRLRGRTQGWKIFVQGMLGTALIGLAFAVIVGIVSQLELSRWIFLVPVVASCIVLGIVLGIGAVVAGWAFDITTRGSGISFTFGKVADSVIIGMWIGTAFTVAILSLPLEFPIGGLGSISSNLNLVALATIGGASGIALSVGDGHRQGLLQSLLIALLAGWFIGPGGIVVHIATGAVVGLSYYLGNRWATRQIPDEETRKRLANPE